MRYIVENRKVRIENKHKNTGGFALGNLHKRKKLQEKVRSKIKREI